MEGWLQISDKLVLNIANATRIEFTPSGARVYFVPPLGQLKPNPGAESGFLSLDANDAAALRRYIERHVPKVSDDTNGM